MKVASRSSPTLYKQFRLCQPNTGALKPRLSLYIEKEAYRPSLPLFAETIKVIGRSLNHLGKLLM